MLLTALWSPAEKLYLMIWRMDFLSGTTQMSGQGGYGGLGHGLLAAGWGRGKFLFFCFSPLSEFQWAAAEGSIGGLYWGFGGNLCE